MSGQDAKQGETCVCREGKGSWGQAAPKDTIPIMRSTVGSSNVLDRQA